MDNEASTGIVCIPWNFDWNPKVKDKHSKVALEIEKALQIYFLERPMK